ncbi:MAG: DMT family transporter [Chloroflexi bacterium]|nr:DMT family transporter [Chloroflexota bacterium]
MSDARKRWLGLALVVTATLFWSTAGLFITTTVRGSGISALGLAFWRVLSASLILFAAFAVIRPSALRVKRRDLPWLAGMGALAVGTFQVLWVIAIMTNGASVSTVIQCNAPIIVTLLARVFWREPLTWRKWAAIGLAFIGTALISGLIGAGTLGITPVGLTISLGSALAYAGITLFSKKLSGRYNSFVILAYSFGFAALALLPFQIGRPLPTQISGLVIAAFAGLVLLTTVAGYGAYMMGLRYLQASVAAIVAMTEVPLAAFWGYVFLGERLDGWQIAGALIVVSGVILLSQRSRSDT